MNLLVILNPRRIEECISALEDLPIDKLWLSNYSEAQIQERWSEVLSLAKGYDNLLVISDDTVPTADALENVVSLLDEHEVVTGYCNLGMEDRRVNICKGPLGEYPSESAYPWYSLDEVQAWPEELVPTTFAGFCLTGMSYEMWERFPYELHNHGNSADFQLSKRLLVTGIPIVAHRDAFVLHVKERWAWPDQEERKKLRVGRDPAEMRLAA